MDCMGTQEGLRTNIFHFYQTHGMCQIKNMSEKKLLANIRDSVGFFNINMFYSI